MAPEFIFVTVLDPSLIVRKLELLEDKTPKVTFLFNVSNVPLFTPNCNPPAPRVNASAS